MNGQKCGLMNGWIGVGRKDGWMRGEMDGGTDRRADRWINRQERKNIKLASS